MEEKKFEIGTMLRLKDESPLKMEGLAYAKAQHRRQGLSTSFEATTEYKILNAPFIIKGSGYHRGALCTVYSLRSLHDDLNGGTSDAVEVIRPGNGKTKVFIGENDTYDYTLEDLELEDLEEHFDIIPLKDTTQDLIADYSCIEQIVHWTATVNSILAKNDKNVIRLVAVDALPVPSECDFDNPVVNEIKAIIAKFSDNYKDLEQYDIKIFNKTEIQQFIEY